MKNRRVRFTKFIVAFSALAGIASGAFAQDQAKSLYERLGGIQKIADYTSKLIDRCSSDKLLLKSKNFAMAAKNFPSAGVKFLVTAYLANKTGGPQAYPASDLAGIYKWFMFTPEQMAEDDKISMEVLMAEGVEHDTAQEFVTWWHNAVMEASPVAPTMEQVQDKDSLYGRLGGIFPIAVVVDDFVNSLATDKTILGNPRTVKALTDGHITGAGLKYLVTEQLGQASGGPWKYSGRSMADAHKGLMISEDEWSAAAKLLVSTLNKYHVPQREQGEILAAIGTTKGDIVGK